MKTNLLVIIFVFSVAFSFSQDTRLENEVKLDIPTAIADSVWHYIVKTYNNSDLGYQTSVAVEKFKDQYYDTPEFLLLKNEDCVRYRKRTYADGEKKELLQIKTATADSSGVIRAETKFKLNKSDGSYKELSSLIKKKDLKDFTKMLKRVDNVENLFPSVKIFQNRSRVYLSKSGSSIATLTFDRVIAESGARSVKFIEMELELNEKAYTAANDSTKFEMEKITAEIKASLLSKFPTVKVDQTPKYVKAANLLQIKPKEIKTTAKIFKYILPLVFLVILFFVVALIRKNKK